MNEFAEAYAATRERMSDLARSLDHDALNTTAPATPEWSVKDLIAHVTGIGSDMLSGNVNEVGQPSWTEAQVRSRKERSLDEILREWEELSPKLEELLGGLHPAMAGLTLADLVTHEHDVRGALGDKGARDTDALRIATDTYVRTAGRSLKATPLPALKVESEDQTWTIGKGEAQSTLQADRFDLFRAIAGRRSREQVLAFRWSGEAEPYLETLSLFGYRDQPLEE